MNEITIHHVNDFVMAMREKRRCDPRLAGGCLSANTIYKYVVSIKSFFFRCYVHDIETVPYDKIQKPKKTHQQPPYLTEKEVRLFWDAPFEVDRNTTTQIRNLLIMKLCYYTGIRWQELRELVFDDLLRGDQLTITGKGGRIRTLTLNDEIQWLAARLRDLYGERDPRLWRHHEKKDYVFISLSDNRRGKKISANTTRDMMNRYKKHLGISKKITLHSFRHTHATQLLRKWANIREVQHSLGHVLIQTTQIYTHISEESANKNIERLKLPSDYNTQERGRIKNMDEIIKSKVQEFMITRFA